MGDFSANNRRVVGSGVAVMSFQAMAWAIEQSPSWRGKFVLIMLANYADEDGVAFPSIKKLQTDCGVGRDTIVRAIKELERLGLVTIERRKVEGVYLRNRYTLVLHPVDANSRPVVADSDQGSRSERPGVVAQSDPNLSDKPIKEPSPLNPPKDFDRFWEAFDHKKSKRTAEKAWAASLKRGNDPGKLISAAAEYRLSKPDKQFMKYPATWLNADCQNDEPEPPKAPNDPKPPSAHDNLVAGYREAVRRKTGMDSQRPDNPGIPQPKRLGPPVGGNAGDSSSPTLAAGGRR